MTKKLQVVGNLQVQVNADSALSSTSENPVQNKVINEAIDNVQTSVNNINNALNEKVDITRTINGKNLSSDIVLDAEDIRIDITTPVENALAEAKSYTDTVADGKSDVNHNHDDVYANKSHGHVISDVTNLQSILDGKAATSHKHDELYDTIGSANSALTQAKSYADEVVSGKANATHNHNTLYDAIGSAEDALEEAKSYTDTEVAKKANTSHTHSISNVTNLQSSLDAKVPTSRTVNGKALSTNITLSASDVNADASGSAASALASAKSYTDEKIDAIVGDGASESLDTIGEISTALKGNADIIDTLNASIGNKADKSHTHTIANVDGLQSALDGKAATSHGTHVSYSTTAPVMDGTASVGSASTVARSDHKHPTDTSRAAKSDLDSHTSNTTSHVTAAERTKWNAAKTHADAAHAPSNAEPNQNAFSNVVVGSTTISADTKTDSLTLAGSNVTLTPDATTDKVTIGITKDNVTSALGYTPPTSNTWRGIQDNLTSDSTTDSLSAKQGKVLKGLVDDKAASSSLTSHTGNTGIHVTSTEKSNWNAAKTHADKKGSGTVSDTNPHGLTPANIGAAASSHNHAASNITSGTLSSDRLPTVPISKGGTGATTAASVLTNLGITATAAELNKMDGVTATTAELNYVDGVTSNIQTQLNSLVTNVNGKAASSHNHNNIVTVGDNRDVATKPSDYSNNIRFQGLKTNTKIGSPSDDSYSYVVGLRGWIEKSGGNAHELAFNNTGIYTRNGATDTWGDWAEVYTSANKPTLSELGAAASSHNHSASNITSGTLSTDRLSTIPVSKGGTGATTAASALTNLGITATSAELNVLDGVTATTTELNYVDGVTSNIQTQLNGKAASSHTHNYAGSSSAGGAATSLSGFKNTTNSATTIDSFTTNGIGYVSGASGVLGQSDGAMYAQGYSSSWVAQIYQDYRTGQIALRGKNNGTWQSWRNVLDSSNYTSYVPTKTGSGASGTWGISVTGNAATATALTSSAGSTTQPVYFSGGKPVATTYTLGKSVPSNAVFTDTHYTTGINAGGSGATTNAATSNPYVTVKDNSTYRSQIQLKGGGATTVSSDANGVITISSTDNNTTYSAATTSANGLMSSADKTKLNGIATGANKTVVDTALSSSSTNPVQNKVIYAKLGEKVNTADITTESWTFTLDDGSEVTKTVVLK